MLEPALKRVQSGGKAQPIVADARQGLAEALLNLGGTFSGDNTAEVALVCGRLALYLRPDLDLAPKEGSSLKFEKKTTSAEYVRALDQAAADARKALSDCTDEHLVTQWQLKVAGNVVQQDTRANMIQDTFGHWSHHRGQMTVYLRLLGAKVPSTFGPSADEKTF